MFKATGFECFAKCIDMGCAEFHTDCMRFFPLRSFEKLDAGTSHLWQEYFIEKSAHLIIGPEKNEAFSILRSRVFFLFHECKGAFYMRYNLILSLFRNMCTKLNQLFF